MKIFKQELAESTPQQLEQIFHLWGMDGVVETTLKNRLDVLLKRVKDPIAARFVWEYLSQDERQVLYRLLGNSARGGIRRDATLKKSQLSEKDFETVLNSLKHYLLIWENTVKVRSQPSYYSVSKSKSSATVEDVALLYPFMENADALYEAGKENFSPKSDRSQMTLDKLLTAFYPGFELDALARHYGIQQGSYYSRVELREIIADELLEPNGAFEIIQKLDAPLRDLLKWVCEKGGKVSMQAIRKHTGYADTKLLNALHTFEEYALAFDTFTADERTLFVPSDTYEYLKKATTQTQAEIAQHEFAPLATPPQTISPADTPMVYDVATIVGAIYQQTIEPTQAGKVPKRLAGKIQPLMHGKARHRYINEEDEYMEMVFHIAQEVGILRIANPSLEGIKSHYEPTAQLEQWSQLNLTGQTQRLLQCWTKSFRWMDIVGVHYRQWDPYSWHPIAARASILEYLKNCTPGQWYSVASLLQMIWDKDPFELRPVHYGIRQADRRKTSGMRTKWIGCEGEYYTGLLSSSLFELGIVALGYQQADPSDVSGPKNPDSFMLTDLGFAALSNLTTDTKPAAKTSTATKPSAKAPVSPMSNGNRSLVLQPNFELLLLHPDMPTLYSLLPFAQVNQVNMVSRLTLTRNSVLRGVEAGRDVEEILRILAESSQKEIPQNVAYTLHDWVKQYKDVRVSQVLLFEVSSEGVADEIIASSKFQKYNLRKLGTRMLIASNDINLSELRRTLEKEGIAVRVSGDIITRQNRYPITSGMHR